jgi:hypothetical protein
LQRCEAQPGPDTGLNCEEAEVAQPGELRINEIHAAPAATDDINCDGTVGSNDEFIEVVNSSDKLLSLDGVEVHYDGKVIQPLRGCIAPGRGLVVLGQPSQCTDLGETQVFFRGRNLSLANSNKQVAIFGKEQVQLDSVIYPSLTGNSSWTRFPDFTGEFVLHTQVPGSKERFSVGKCVSGAPLALGCPVPDTGSNTGDCEDAVPPPPNALRINEIHAAPWAGEPAHDANCDGNPSSTQDEFVEVVNASTQKVSLARVSLLVGGNTRHTFDTCLEPGQGLVLYSGGTAACTDLAPTIALVSSKALSMSNSGGSVSLVDGEGNTLDSQAYGSISDNRSRTLFPDFTGAAMVRHSPTDILGVEAPHSAGKCVSGEPLTINCALPGGITAECGNEACEPGESVASCPEDCAGGVDCSEAVDPTPGDVVINEVHPAPRAGLLEHDSNCDGNPSSTQDEFIEVVNVTDQTIALDGVQVLAQGNVKATLSTCLLPGRGLVIYSGGTAACTNLGPTQAVIASSALGLTNSGGSVSLVDADGVILDSQVYRSISDNTSRTRFPDFLGAELVRHSAADIPSVSRPQSAGLCVSGAHLTPDCPPPGEAAECGNGACEVGESPDTCPDDCDANCGNGACDEGETFETCSRDCPAPIFCADGTSPNPGDLRINEVHFAPNSAQDDVNCDGVTSSDDEFIELINASDRTLNLADVTLAYDGTNRHTFNAREACLAPGQALVFYNRNLVPLCSRDQLGGSAAVVTRSAFSMTNTSGKSIALRLDDAVIDATTYTTNSASNSNASWTRSPDITGAFTRHSDAPGNVGRFSVGTCLNGGRFPNCQGSTSPVCGDGFCSGSETSTSCPQDCSTDPVCGDGFCNGGETNASCPQDCPPTGPVCGNSTCEAGETNANCPQDCGPPPCADGVTPTAGQLVINEIHFAPNSGQDDVNCDGINSADDEFIEIVNTSNQTLNLDGVAVTQAGTVRHTFTAAQACLAPGQGLVLYNALAAAITTTCAPGASTVGGSLTVKSSTRFPLSNSTGSEIALRQGATTLDAQTYTPNSVNASWVRSPDLTGGFTRHNLVSPNRFSLGRCINGNTFPDCGPLPPVCGNSVCEAGETNANCPADCPPAGPVCGNGTCEAGETNASCPADCPPAGPVCGNGTCEAGETNASCPADCPPTGPVCGNGTCEAGEDFTSCPGDCPPPPCADGVAPTAGQLVINEIHFAPNSGQDDVNCDGINSADDEFIELVNTSGQTLNLEGVTVAYAGTVRHTFTAAQACLAPGQGLVFYNAFASSVTSVCAPGAAEVSGSLTVRSSSRFQMNNTTGTAVAIALGATPLDAQTYTTNSVNASWVRSPDLTGSFTRHNLVSPNRFSLGRCINGNTFPNCQ